MTKKDFYKNRGFSLVLHTEENAKLYDREYDEQDFEEEYAENVPVNGCGEPLNLCTYFNRERIRG